MAEGGVMPPAWVEFIDGGEVDVRLLLMIVFHCRFIRSSISIPQP